MPETVVSCVYGLYRDAHNTIISKESVIELLKNRTELFVKPSIDSCSGEGCMALDFEGGGGYFNG